MLSSTYSPLSLAFYKPNLIERTLHFVWLVGLAVLCLIPMLIPVVLTGCTTNPQLQAYRSSLHDLDEKIYQDDLGYIADAEKAGTRSPDVIYVQRRAVQQAESFYQTYAPTTQP